MKKEEEKTSGDSGEYDEEIAAPDSMRPMISVGEDNATIVSELSTPSNATLFRGPLYPTFSQANFSYNEPDIIAEKGHLKDDNTSVKEEASEAAVVRDAARAAKPALRSPDDGGSRPLCRSAGAPLGEAPQDVDPNVERAAKLALRSPDDGGGRPLCISAGAPLEDAPQDVQPDVEPIAYSGIPSRARLPAEVGTNLTARTGAISVQGSSQVMLQAAASSAIGLGDDLSLDNSNHASPSVPGQPRQQASGELLVEATLVADNSHRTNDANTEQPQEETQPRSSDATLLVDAKPMEWHINITKRTCCICLLVLLVLGGVLAGVLSAALLDRTSDTKKPPFMHTNVTEADTASPFSSGLYNATNTWTSKISTLTRIRASGILKCGVALEALTREFHRQQGEENMMDTELCRSIAAAALGREHYHMELIQIPLAQRAQALANGTVDVMQNAFGQTMDREVYDASAKTALKFASPHTYTASSFGGLPEYVTCADNSLRHIEECSNLKICVFQGTRQVDKLALQVPRQTIVEIDSYHSAFMEFARGGCNVILSVGFLEFRSIMRAENYTGPFSVSNGVFLMEPLAPATRADDPQWSSFVHAVKLAWFAAERYGITQSNVDDPNRSPRLVRPTVFGDEHRNMFYDAIAVSGNYGEMYERRIVSELFPRLVYHYAVNESNRGALISHPFGRTDVVGPPPSGTMARVLELGKLSCAVVKEPLFAPNQIQLLRLDMEFCRAIAAGLLGDPELVDFTLVENRMYAFGLLEGDVLDVLAGATWNLQTSVRYNGTGSSGFSFSQPYFYNTTVVDVVGSNLESNRCLATRQEDHQWATFVYWIVNAIIYAEETGVTRDTANTMPTVSLYGPELTLVLRNAIGGMGNYWEIWERNLGQVLVRQGRNLLFNKTSPSPLIPIMPGIVEL